MTRTRPRPPPEETALTSLTYKHQRVQRLRRLVSRRSARQAERSFVVEGAKVLAEAFAAGAAVESVYVDRSVADPANGVERVLDAAYAAGTRVFDLAPGVLSRVADTVTPQPVMAILPQTDVRLDALAPAGGGADLVVVCVDLRDPGNAGTVIRSAEAAGASGVVFCHGSVDMFNPKTVRASAGALFRLAVVAGGEPSEVVATLAARGLACLGTTARGGVDYTAVDLTRSVALVLGNEAHGVPAGLMAGLDGQVTIPMAPGAESLNAGMAAAVMCFEAARQRRGPVAVTGADRSPTVGAGR